MSETEPSPPAPDVDETRILEIADGVWVIPDRRVPLVPNIGIVVGEDAGARRRHGMGPKNGARVLAAAKEKAGGRPCSSRSTHFHPEHGFGLQVFRDEAHIVYNSSQLEELREKGGAMSSCSRRSGRTSPRRSRASSSSSRTRRTTASGPSSTSAAGRSAPAPWAGTHTRRPGRLAPRGADPLHRRPRRVADLPDLPVLPARRRGRQRQPWIEVLRWLEGLEPDQVGSRPRRGPGRRVITDARDYHERLRELTFAQADAGASADEAVASARTRHPRALSRLDSARVGRASASAASTPNGLAKCRAGDSLTCQSRCVPITAGQSAAAAA